jgi:tyrosine-protein kinase Etk/Wzc
MLQENISKTNDNFEQYKARISNFSGEFELGLFIHIARKSLIWVIAFFLLALAGALLYLRYTQPVYESSSVIQLQTSDNANKILKVDNIAENQNELAEAVELLRSKVFFKRILSKLPLEIGYFSEGTFKSEEQYTATPFTVESKIFDPSIIGSKIYIDFTNINSGIINYQIKDKSISKSFKTGTPVKFEHFEIIIAVRNYKEIQAQQSLVKKNAYYFVFNDLNTLVNQLYPNLEVKLLNNDAKTILQRLS